jgi:hypothetical protein
VNLENHDYTGIFKSGGDTGYVRLSSGTNVVEDVESEEEEKMKPTMAVKILRDHIDSANALANKDFGGQNHYNFFEPSLESNCLRELRTEGIGKSVDEKLKESSDWIHTLGHLDFAKYD